MGGRVCRYKQTGNRPITIVILGVENAGKTTVAKVLEKTSVDWVVSTVGFTQHEVKHNNEKIKLYDLGGSKTFREAWRHYYDDPYGFIYVIDYSEQDRLDENREVLQEKIQNKPILILANKQDKIEALDKNTILENLKIEQLLNDHRNLYRVELCTAKLTKHDTQKRKEAKRKREELVLKIREERAKQEGRENDHHPTTNGFIPIEQAVKNAETKSTS